jgi:hypothetical protein
LVSLGIGTALGVMALDRRDEAEPHCNTRDVCDAYGVALREEAFDLAHGSTATLVGGGVLLAGGVVLFFVPELVPAAEGEESSVPDTPDEGPAADPAQAARRRRPPQGPSVAVHPSLGGVFVSGQW